MFGLVVIVAFFVILTLIGLWARYWERNVDDYYEREYQDPPAHGWTMGGGPGGI